MGSGTADSSLAQARFSYLRGIAVDPSGNVYLTDAVNHNRRNITPAGVAGDADGPGSAASFTGPRGIALDKAGNVYVADTENNLVRRISTGSEVTMMAGKRGYTGNELGALDGALNWPMGLAFIANGVLLVTSAKGIFKLPL